MKTIMRKLKIKYPALGRNVTLESLCGNKFYKNEITVTKYLSGMIILKNMRNLLNKRNENGNV